MSELHTIENEQLRVSVSDWGAELCSIYDKKADREVIWTAQPEFWNRHAPVLFPFVGKVTGGHYTCEGEKYPTCTQRLMYYAVWVFLSLQVRQMTEKERKCLFSSSSSFSSYSSSLFYVGQIYPRQAHSTHS